MNKNHSTESSLKAKDYYDSNDADNFYFHIWGGEDIHVGLYKEDDDSISDASRRTVEKMAAKIRHFPAGSKALDLGSGYGGSARHLARENGYHVQCLNISQVQNERNRELNLKQGLAVLVEVTDGSFEDIPFSENAFDLVWSQDALLHSGNRKRVFEEVDRVLRPGGEFIFTDPMQRFGTNPEILQPVLERIHLNSMGSIDDYESYAQELGWSVVEVDEMTPHLIEHYSRVLKELEQREASLHEHCSEDYMQKMKAGLAHWINAGKMDALSWGILRFQKKPENGTQH